MIKKILAVVAAAVCAGAIVGFVPEPAPAVAAGTSQAARSQGTSMLDSNKPAVVAAARVPEIRKAVCTQGWPYYEQSCLHDGRRSDGKARVVRVVTASHSVAGRTSQSRR
jgi:hypothetical protein